MPNKTKKIKKYMFNIYGFRNQNEYSLFEFIGAIFLLPFVVAYEFLKFINFKIRIK